MSNYIDQDRSEISKEGLIGTIVFHAILLLLFLLFTLQSNWQEPQEGGIMLNFGTDEAGWGDVQPMSNESNQAVATDLISPAPENSPPPSPETTPTPDKEQSLLTSNEKEAPEIGAKDDKKKDAPKTAPKDNKTPTKNTTTNNTTNGKNTDNNNAQTPAAKPSIDPNSLFKGSKGNNATSQGNTQGGTGDEGHKMGGADISGNNGGAGTGGGVGGAGTGGNSGVAANVPGRKFISVPPISDTSQEIGTVVVKIKVNRQGEVIEAKFTSQGSTTTSSVLTSKAVAAAKKAKFNQELNAPEVQNGTMTFRFKVK